MIEFLITYSVLYGLGYLLFIAFIAFINGLNKEEIDHWSLIDGIVWPLVLINITGLILSYIGDWFSRKQKQKKNKKNK